MALFKKGLSPHMAALAMIGAKAGDRVLAAGHPEPALAVQLARVTGLTGQVVVAAPPAAIARFERAAAEEGVLLETREMSPDSRDLPQADGTHDLVSIHAEFGAMAHDTRLALVASAVSALRPGGRLLLVDGRRRTGLFSGRSQTAEAGVVLALLAGPTVVAARVLGNSEGVTYFEARKPKPTAPAGEA